MVNADDQRLDAEKISEYCKKFFKDNRNYFYRPFIPKYSDVYIEEDMKVSDELATLFSDQIEGLAVKFLGQIQMFRDWLDENRPEPEVYIDILNDLESIVPPDLSKMYESRVEDWLVKTEENSRNPSPIHLQRRNKRLLRNIHFPELAHLFLTSLLLVQQLPLTRDVAAIALRGHVFAQG